MSGKDIYFELESGTVIRTNTPDAWEGGGHKRLPVAIGKRHMAEQARTELLRLLAPADTVYTVLRHVSRSGMRRQIDLYTIKDGELIYLSGYASSLLDRTIAHGNGDGIIADGCGQDMGYSLVYDLGAALWPSGTDKPHGTRNGKPDRTGGYALRHRWI